MGIGDVKMEMMGEVFRTHELGGGSMGSCAREECSGGGQLFLSNLSLFLVYTNNNLSTSLLSPKLNIIVV